MTGLFAFLVLIGWGISYSYGEPTILYLAIIISIVMNISSYWFSDKIALAVSHAKPVTREQYFDLYTVTENLSIAAGLPMPKLYVIDDPAPNAFATGRNEKHAAIAVTTGLLERLDRTELEGVIAHELSHIGNDDILISTVVVMLVGTLALLSDMTMRMSFRSGDREGGSSAAAIISVVAVITAPIAATLLQLAISRKREFLADASGALLTRYPEGLASALEKISSYSAPLKHAHNATAHLFISNPFGDGQRKKIGFFTKLFMTHPPVNERIAVLRGNNAVTDEITS